MGDGPLFKEHPNGAFSFFSLFWGYHLFPAFLGPKGLAYVAKVCHFVYIFGPDPENGDF
jgi:hypothetical protein